MTQSWVDDTNLASTSAPYSGSQPVTPHFPSPSTTLKHGGSNVFQLLAFREIAPQARRSPKRLWGGASKWSHNGVRPNCEAIDAKHGLLSWVEAESLRHLSANYCPLVPPPRSTIAAAFSPDGKILASTHGDHTVKIIDCQTGRCLKVLSGHRRTPWVVRFHPVHSEILASGSLDHEVRLWDASTSECIGFRDFYRPIASIAFHAQGELLAVASGHKLYIWHYNRRGETSSPTIVLKTRRSLRAVHFHPYAAPFLLTAEVNDLDSPDSPMTLATSPGYLHFPPPAVFFANVPPKVSSNQEARVPLVPLPCLFWPTFVRQHGNNTLLNDTRGMTSSDMQRNEDSSGSVQTQIDLNISSRNDYLISPMEMSPMMPSTDGLMSELDTNVCDAMDTTETTGIPESSSPGLVERFDDANGVPITGNQSNRGAPHTPIRQSRLFTGMSLSTIHPSYLNCNADYQTLLRSIELGQLHQFLPFGDPTCWELPFLQGWLMGQSHAGLQPVLPLSGGVQENSVGVRGSESDCLASNLMTAVRNVEAASASLSMGSGFNQSRATGLRSASRHRSRSRLVAPTGSGEGTTFHIGNDDANPQPPELATSLANAGAAELPCTVKLRIWPHNIQNPCAPLDADTCRLIIPHAVLCSEMGAHFSPCGRFLAACVACVLPHMEADPGLHSQVHHEVAASTSPTRHPISARQVMYELRIYSLEESTFGTVLTSRAIRAAHCLTSIQFSPTSEHILLAYGRRHSSLLRSIVVDGETTIPIYTILEKMKLMLHVFIPWLEEVLSMELRRGSFESFSVVVLMAQVVQVQISFLRRICLRVLHFRSSTWGNTQWAFCPHFGASNQPHCSRKDIINDEFLPCTCKNNHQCTGPFHRGFFVAAILNSSQKEKKTSDVNFQ
ncbi:uncharacterized protein [Aristolochia californica]|uniref:uncharacterized protein isoform X2 n=1 Tax=Aristolochia californica TaxID=171875 RepID=UPI0035E00921